MDHAECLAHVEALEASIAELCSGAPHLHQAALDPVDRLTWGQASRAETTRGRHVRALVTVISELRVQQWLRVQRG